MRMRRTRSQRSVAVADVELAQPWRSVRVVDNC
jgi:hypothetical protein